MTAHKRLISFGCSMTAGDELEGFSTNPLICSEHTYVGVMAKRMGLEHICMARPGMGNDGIFRVAMQSVLSGVISTGDFVVIGWSGMARREYYHSPTNSYVSLFPAAISVVKDIWAKTVYRDDISDLCDAYEIESGFRNDAVDLQIMQHYVWSLSSVFKERGVSHLMNAALWGVDEPIPEFPSEFYTDDVFISWAKQHHPVHAGGHPVEAAHTGWADKLLGAI